MVSVFNLASILDWRAVLQKLDLAASSDTLPCQINCPNCQKVSLTIYHDTARGGDWHLCNSCNISGDTLQLLALLINSTIEDAFYFAVRNKMFENRHFVDVETFKRYKAHFVDRQIATVAFWNESKNFFLRADQDVAGLRHKLGFTNLYDWEYRTGKYIGANTKKRVIDYSNRSKFSLSTGWEQCMVVPVFDMPGRINGFVLLVLKDEDMILTDVIPAYPTDKVVTGVAFIGGVTATHKGMGNGLFVINDLITGCKLIYQHSNVSSEELPMIATHNNLQLPDFVRFNGRFRDSVVWSETITDETLTIAKLLNGKVKQDITSTPTSAYRVNPKAWLLAMEAESMPWRDALQKHIGNSNLIQVSTTISKMNLHGDDLRHLIEAYPSNISDKLKIVLKETAVRKIRFDNIDIIEDDTGWTNMSNGQTISEVVIRIDQIILRQDSTDEEPRNVWYRGRLRFKGSEVAFTVDRDVFEKNPFKWSVTRLLQHGKSLPAYKDSYRSKIVDIAAAFHKPEVCLVPLSYGWDKRLLKFVLPNFSIDLGGKVHDRLFEPVEENCPAINLPKPLPITPTDFHNLAAIQSNILGVVGVILRNILAPAYGETSKGVLVSCGMKTVAKIAEAAGCPVIEELDNLKQLQTCASKGDYKSWPVVATTTIPSTPRSWNAFLQNGANVMVYNPNRQQTNLAYLNGKWSVLEVPDKYIPAEAYGFIGNLVVDFLQYIAEYLNAGLWDEPLDNKVQRFLQEYLLCRGCSISCLELAFQQVWPVERKTKALFAVLLDLLENNDIQASPNSTIRKTKVDNVENLEVHMNAVNVALFTRNQTPLELTDLKRSLEIEPYIQDWSSSDVWFFKYSLWEQYVSGGRQFYQ